MMMLMVRQVESVIMIMMLLLQLQLLLLLLLLLVQRTVQEVMRHETITYAATN